MKNLEIRCLTVCFSVLFLFFAGGCTVHRFGISTEPDSLKVLTPEDIESIFAEISYETTDKYPIETDINGNEIVYWLEGGSVWHVSQACSTVKKSDPKKVKIGSPQDALDNGKDRPCKICGNNFDYTQFTGVNTDVDTDADTTSSPNNDKNHKEYSEDGELIVFWLDGGKVWHESRYCSRLSRSDPEKLLRGSIAQAISAGKERVCKNCSD